MQKYSLTKVWGYYDPPTWPVLGFGTLGGVTKFQSEYTTGDWVVLVGTQGEPTIDEERGRLLGMVQVTNTVVDVKSVLESLKVDISVNAYRDDGAFRRPNGFPYLRAQLFPEKPFLAVVLPKKGGRNARADVESAHDIEQMLHKHLEQYSEGYECFSVPSVIAALGSMVYEYSKKS